MTRLLKPHEDGFPKLLDWMRGRLQAVPDDARIWPAFLRFSGLDDDAKARQVIRYGTDPIVFLETLTDTEGYFDPDRPSIITLRKDLATPASAADALRLERTVMHELVHWSWASLGRREAIDEERGWDFEQAAYDAQTPVAELPKPRDTKGLGELSARWESHGKSDAIGRDKNGGWSYGRYQISSRVGTLGEFLRFLDRRAEWQSFADALRLAGGEADAKIGSDRFLTAWKTAAANPDFADAEHAFIETTHYQPLVTRLVPLGVDVARRSLALMNVTWSVAVQHGVGGGTVVFSRAVTPLPTGQRDRDDRVIRAVYAERRRVDVYFSKSTPSEREAVRQRFDAEEVAALGMLQQV